MVCMPGHFKMASVLKHFMMENRGTLDDVMNDNGAGQILHKQLFDAHEPNLLDEDDMHIFGSKPMVDPLDLVCCNTCKKPVKASQYSTHAGQCASGKVNKNDSVGADDDSGPKKPSRKGKKIKLTSNGTIPLQDKKVHAKVKAKSQPENRNNTNGFDVDNGHVNKVQPIDSPSVQRLQTSADNPAVINAPKSHHRDAPVPLATKMYHSQGNYRLRLELGQLYRQSCAQHSVGYTTTNSSQENSLMASHLPTRDNSALYGAQKSSVTQTKSMDQLFANTPESSQGIPQQLAASVPNRPQATKSQRADVQVPTVRKETARVRCSKDSVRHSKNTGNKKTQQQANRAVPVIKSPVE